MANLINDGSLIGFWPLNEPSGTALWKNYSPARAKHPSGLSFDMQVHVADVNNIYDDDSHGSLWPGLAPHQDPISGINYQGLILQGQNERRNANGPFSYAKCLLLGRGEAPVRRETLGPAVAQSGFTAGLWVLPLSDGWLDANGGNGFNLASDSWYTGFARLHSLMGQFTQDIGWMMGISGQLAYATPVSDSEEGKHQLRAFLLADQNGGIPDKIDTPIESGHFTHLTMSYRYTDGTNNELVLYKDGRVAASGTTNQDIVFDSNPDAGVDSRPLGLGNGYNPDGGAGTDGYESSQGYGHMVSGAYFFRRPLHEGEVLEMHQRGGLQPDYALQAYGKKVLLTDTDLIAYVEGRDCSYIDSSKNAHNFQAIYDRGGPGIAHSPGPFNSTLTFFDSGSNLSITAPSGACFDLANGSTGFTVAGHFCPRNTDGDRDGNMIVSFGSVGTNTTNNTNLASLTEGNTAGFNLTYTNDTDVSQQVVQLEAFPAGYSAGQVKLRSSIAINPIRAMYHHVAITYDNASRDLKLFIDGHEQDSATLDTDFQDQLLRLAGSGYPVMFGNGITDDVADTQQKGIFSAGGDEGAYGNLALFGRPLEGAELRWMAVSGIDTTQTWATRYDSRLLGYWPCDTAGLDDYTAQDVAMQLNPVLGHLNRGESNAKWEQYYDTDDNSSTRIYKDDGTAVADLYGDRTVPDELASYGNLGISSGTWSPLGGSFFAEKGAQNVDARNASVDAIRRFATVSNDIDINPQDPVELIFSYEVTPSGNIPELDVKSRYAFADLAKGHFNSTLHNFGWYTASTTSRGKFSSFLTTVNKNGGGVDGEAGSGVTVAFSTQRDDTSTSITPVISGTLPYGVPSRVLFHYKYTNPYDKANYLSGDAPVQVSLYINGTKVNQVTNTVTYFKLGSNQSVGDSNGDWRLQFGGMATDNTIVSQVLADSGLGEIYLREIFMMRGMFAKEEVAALAASGIQTRSIPGYIGQAPTSQVSINDSALEGYWRFNGFDGNVGEVSNSPGGSGTTDLSTKGNHLDAIAQRFYEQGTNVDLAESLRAVQGPYRNSSLGVECSGFHNQSIQPTFAGPQTLPPFAVSGVNFDSPADGFSVGFLLCKKRETAVNRAEVLLAYGQLTEASNGSVSETTLHPNRGWAVHMTDTDDMRITISTGGNMYLDNVANAAHSGQVTAQVYGAAQPYFTDKSYNNWKEGQFGVASFDYWAHYAFTYDPSNSGVRAYINGTLVDEQFIDPNGFVTNPWTGGPTEPQTPLEPTARMMTFRSHATASDPGDSWTFSQGNLGDYDSIMTDVFYFSRPLDEPEVRYIAFNGIDTVTGTEASGTIGGFLRGQDTGSGIIGGLSRGQLTGSGLIGGFAAAGLLASGIIGGYVSGVEFGTGTIGGWVRGQDDVSGIFGGFAYSVDIGSGSIAGYIRGQEVGSGLFGGIIYAIEPGSGIIGGLSFAKDIGSGLIGGYMLGGLQGRYEFDAGFNLQVVAAENFDAVTEVVKTASSDFDAKVVVFQNEETPYVDIPIPEETIEGLAPPFNQYFVGYASGRQGKTITSTKWTFGDLTPSESVAASGEVLYPIQHRYAASGFYIAKFEAIDSDGLHASALRIVNAASGINPTIVTLSGVPRAGEAELLVDFTTTIDTIPEGVSVATQLLNFDDGQTTISFNPTHAYTQPGTFKPVWCVRDSRGVIWCDSLEAGNDYLENQ